MAAADGKRMRAQGQQHQTWVALEPTTTYRLQGGASLLTPVLTSSYRWRVQPQQPHCPRGLNVVRVMNRATDNLPAGRCVPDVAELPPMYPRSTPRRGVTKSRRRTQEGSYTLCA